MSSLPNQKISTLTSTPNYSILKDPQKNRELIQKGYIVLPILNQEEVAYFNELYKKWHPTTPTEFYKSYFSNNQEYKKEVEEAIFAKCLPKIQEYFTDYKEFGAMFVVKPEGDKGHIPPHQDWSFVDETEHWSLNMWLPIQNTSEKNGSIRFLPESHFFIKSVRGANAPQLYSHLLDEIEQHLVDVPLAAGEAVFFYHGIVHCSHYNFEKKERICIGFSLVQQSAPLIFSHYDEYEKVLTTYSIPNPDFYMTLGSERNNKPQGLETISSSPYIYNYLDKEELQTKLKKRNQ